MAQRLQIASGSKWGWTILALSALLALGCKERPVQRAAAEPTAAGVPTDAFFVVSVPALNELVALAQQIEPIDVTAADDGDKPAWLACDPDACILSRASTVEQVSRHGASWLVPDARGSLVVWGPKDRGALDAALEAARQGKPPVGDDWSGWILPGPLLERWKPTQQRAQDLLLRVIAQAGRVDFTLDLRDDSLDAELRMQPRPGEPVLIADLGEPTATLPGGDALLAPGMLAVARVAADPTQLWKLLRSTLSVERRGQLDTFQQSLRDELEFDIEADVLGSLSGQIAVFAYSVEPSDDERQLGDYFTLGATKEAVLLGVKDRDRLRRALDTWTQISQSKEISGALRAQRSRDEQLEWAWVDDGELRWSATLGDDSLVIVDSSVALDRAETLQEGVEAPSEATPKLETRGATRLVEGTARSGIYLDVAKLRAADETTFSALPEQLVSATITVDREDASELVRVRLTWAASAD